jgi:hypothetical protein
MDYENPLDHLIHRFQHRWETNSQFRAAMSGVLGLSLIVFLCVGVAGVNAVATRVFAAVGFGGAGNQDQGNLSPGGQIVNGNWTFYTPTVPDWKGGATPGSNPIGNSQTPQPSPTPSATPPDAPTATPCKANCGGGGQTGNVTASWTPSTWTSGMSGGTFTVHTSNASDGSPKARVGVAIIMHWATGTYLDENGETTDANGNYTSHPPLTGVCPSNHQYLVYVQTFWPAHLDSNFFVPCA